MKNVWLKTYMRTALLLNVMQSLQLGTCKYDNFKTDDSCCEECIRNKALEKKKKIEVGSSAKISFIGVPQIMSHSKESKAVWKLDIDDTELIDSDILLDEEDLKKPDLASLKGT
uniref:Uncharacterized protein n=1 Tax=Timema tahoe TaxID=61484 RepID=A0A7R9ISY1_9NEOP|nr:unnamed protein product [Timema tahoe]